MEMFVGQQVLLSALREQCSRTEPHRLSCAQDTSQQNNDVQAVISSYGIDRIESPLAHDYSHFFDQFLVPNRYPPLLHFPPLLLVFISTWGLWQDQHWRRAFVMTGLQSKIGSKKVSLLCSLTMHSKIDSSFSLPLFGCKQRRKRKGNRSGILQSQLWRCKAECCWVQC